MDKLDIVKTTEEKFKGYTPDQNTMVAVKIAFSGNELLFIDANGQVKATNDLSFIAGYDASQTQTLKQVNGVLQWVNG